MNEREISLVDLMVEILLHWRVFIIWMAAGAVLLGAFSYVRSGNAVKEQQTATEKMALDPEAGLTEEELQSVNDVLTYEKIYLAKKAYQEKAPIMQIDPNQINKAEVIIAISSEKYRKSEDIASVYEDIVNSGEFVESIAEDVGMETVGVSELLYLNRTSGSYFDGMEDSAALDDSEKLCTFRMAVVHGDEETCKKMVESALAFLREKKSVVEGTLGKHEIKVVNESFGVVSDDQIADRQKAVLDGIIGLRKTISDTKDKWSDAEREYYIFMNSDPDAEAEETTWSEDVPTAGVSVKYVLLGAVMAAFVYAFILLLLYIFNTKIRETDSLQELYGIPQLGLIPAQPGRKKVFGFVDRWILSVRDHNKRRFSTEEALELAAVAAKMAAGKGELKNICLVGCGLKERSLDACEKMKARLESESICVTILNNVLYDAQMLAELEKAEGAVLVEGAGATLYNEIAEELELLKRQDIKVLGAVLVG